MAEVPTAPLGRLVQIDEGADQPGRAEDEHAEGGHLEAQVDAESPQGGPERRAEQCEPGAVADDLEREGLDGSPGDGEVGQDDLGQAGDLLDVALDEVPRQAPGTGDPLADDVEGGGRVLAAQPGQRGSQRQRRREEAPQHGGETDADAESGDDHQCHRRDSASRGPLSKRRGMGTGRASRFMAANPQANRDAAASSATCPAGVPKGLK